MFIWKSKLHVLMFHTSDSRNIALELGMAPLDRGIISACKITSERYSDKTETTLEWSSERLSNIDEAKQTTAVCCCH